MLVRLLTISFTWRWDMPLIFSDSARAAGSSTNTLPLSTVGSAVLDGRQTATMVDDQGNGGGGQLKSLKINTTRIDQKTHPLLWKPQAQPTTYMSNHQPTT
jgi:hypothetical protein